MKGRSGSRQDFRQTGETESLDDFRYVNNAISMIKVICELQH